MAQGVVGVGGGRRITLWSQPHALGAAAVFSFQPQRLFLGKQTHAQHPQPSGGFISKKPKA